MKLFRLKRKKGFVSLKNAAGKVGILPPLSAGFTLIEMVVSVSVFALALGGIMGSYLAILSLNEKARSQRVVEQNARFIMDYLTREIRNGSLDFSQAGYNGNVINQGEVPYLYINNASGDRETIAYNSNALQLTKGGTTTNLSGSDVTIVSAFFFIWPNNQTEQNSVTFAIRIRSNSTIKAVGQAELTIQSTVATRDY